jgi:hypothetical protein
LPNAYKPRWDPLFLDEPKGLFPEVGMRPGRSWAVPGPILVLPRRFITKTNYDTVVDPWRNERAATARPPPNPWI